jgi:toxin-antitoxin system PIN domain toxin
MICLDVNVLVHAHRLDAPDHRDYADLLVRLANDSEPLGLPDIVLSGFLRVVTNRRVFKVPTPTRLALESVNRLIDSPAGILLRSGERHWSTFVALVDALDARGNDIPDAYIAAYAVENNATLLSADRGFARFERLRWRHPLAD